MQPKYEILCATQTSTTGYNHHATFLLCNGNQVQVQQFLWGGFLSVWLSGILKAQAEKKLWIIYSGFYVEYGPTADAGEAVSD